MKISEYQTNRHAEAVRAERNGDRPHTMRTRPPSQVTAHFTKKVKERV